MTQPRPLSDADLLVWAVVLEHRRRQEHAGHRFMLLTFPPCPTCGEQVTQAHTWWTRDPIQFDGFIDMQPCGHQHQAAAEDLERLHDHATEMLESLRHDVRSTEDLVQEAHARIGGTPWCCNGNAEDCPLCVDPNPPYPFLCPGHPRTAANERIVGETAQPATEATELDSLRREVAAARTFAAEMRDFCSPHGVAVDYADRLIEAMDRARDAR